MGLFLPAPPHHPEVGVVKLVGEVAKRPFGVEVGEGQPVGGGAVGADEQGEEMLGHFNGEVPQLFFV